MWVQIYYFITVDETKYGDEQAGTKEGRKKKMKGEKRAPQISALQKKKGGFKKKKGRVKGEKK